MVMPNRTSFNRRDFLRAAGLTGGAGVLGPGLLAGCAEPSSSSQDGGRITFLTGENNPATVSIFEQAFESFEEANSGTTVVGEFLASSSAEQRLIQLLGSNDPPDMGKLDDTDIGDLALQGLLEPVTDVVNAMSNVPEGARLIIDGEDYMVPSEFGIWLMFCRLDLLDAAGVAPPQTWAEFTSVMEALDGREERPNLFVTNAASSYVSDTFLNYGWSNGVQPWSWTGDAWAVTLDEAGNVERAKETLEFFKQRAMYSSPTGNYDWADVNQAYASGSVAIIEYAGARTLDYLRREAPDIADKTGVAVLPVSQELAVRSAAGGYCVFRKEGRDQQAVKDLALSLVSGDTYRDYLWTVPGHLIPTDKTMLEGEWSSHEVLVARPDLLEAITATYDRAYNPLRGGPRADEASALNVAGGAVLQLGIYNEMVAEVVVQDRNPDEAISDAAAKMREFQETLSA